MKFPFYCICVYHECVCVHYIEASVVAFYFSVLISFWLDWKMRRGEQVDGQQTQSSSSPSSSIDSSNYPSGTAKSAASSSSSSSSHSSSSCLSSVCRNANSSKTDLITDLRLGLTISPSQPGFSNSNPRSRNQTSDWPPIKSILRSTLVEKQNQCSQRPSLFVKVYMEGIPIGRKLNLLAHHSYDELVRALGHMFRTTILCPNSQPLHSGNFHVLTYEDQEGDWMMVGDVPWEMFLISVKRLKITRADRC